MWMWAYRKLFLRILYLNLAKHTKNKKKMIFFFGIQSRESPPYPNFNKRNIPTLKLR